MMPIVPSLVSIGTFVIKIEKVIVVIRGRVRIQVRFIVRVRMRVRMRVHAVT